MLMSGPVVGNLDHIEAPRATDQSGLGRGLDVPGEQKPNAVQVRLENQAGVVGYRSLRDSSTSDDSPRPQDLVGVRTNFNGGTGHQSTHRHSAPTQLDAHSPKLLGGLVVDAGEDRSDYADGHGRITQN